ncbi:MAG: aminotransferase class III-fold pyridoxal phosphate-dependent enzyme, partial [Brevundimonas sp.]
MAKAVHDQLMTLDYTMPFTRAHPKAFELAQRVAQYTPEGLNRVFFTCSGSESVDSAMKMALAYHRIRGQGHRQRFVSRERAYHGLAGYGTSIVGTEAFKVGVGPLAGGTA